MLCQPHPFPRFHLCLLALVTCFTLQSPAWAAFHQEATVLDSRSFSYPLEGEYGAQRAIAHKDSGAEHDLGHLGSALFALAEPGQTYLIESDPAFTNKKFYLSSDYYFEQWQMDPQNTLKRLGDGWFEQKLLRDQVEQLTGQRFLPGYANDEAEYRALMDSGIAYAESWNLVPGVALTAEQMAQLTANMVWLVEEAVTMPDGTRTTALMPRLYLARNENAVSGTALIAAANVSINNQGDIYNSGTINGINNLRLAANNINNAGALTGGNVRVVADNDFISTGAVQGGNEMTLVAGNDLTIETTSSRNDWNSGHRTVANQSASVTLGESATGKLTLAAGNDINLNAASLINGSPISQTRIEAGNNVNLGTVETGYAMNFGSGKNTRHEKGSAEVGTEIQAQGDIAIIAGNDLNAKGAYVSSDAGILLAANKDIHLSTAKSTMDLENAVKNTGSNGILSSGSQTRYWETHSAENQGSVVSGASVLLQSGHDTRVTGGQVVSDNGTTIIAGNDLIIAAAADSDSGIYEQKEKKSGAFSSGASFTIGNQQENTRQVQTGKSNAAAVIGSIEGDVNLMADHAYTQTASQVLAPAGDIRIQGQSVDIFAGQDTYTYDSRYTFEQSGLTVGVSAPIMSAVQGVLQASQNVGQSKDERVNALAAANAGLAGYQAYEAGQSLAQGLNNPDTSAAQAAQVSISITVGNQKNEQTSHIESSHAAASEVSAGKNITITAIGGEERQGDLTIRGSDLIAQGDIRLTAQDNIHLIAAEQSVIERDENKSSGWNAGVAITAGQDGWSFGITAGGNVGKGYGDGDETSYRNTHVDSQGTVTLQSEADTNLIGARVKGEQVEIDAQNLILQSLQDTATFEGKQQNASAQVTVGYGFSASGSYSQSRIDADYKSVTEQTAILAGDGGYQINVRNNTDLTGALITSTQAAEDQQKNSLSTGTLTSSDLQNYARYEGSSFGIGASGGFNADFGLGENATPQGSNATNENGTLKTGADSLAVSQSIGFGSDSESDSNTTRSGINTRNITITDEQKQQAITGQTAAETIASLYTPTTTDTAEQNSGALQNNFDQDKVQKELDLQREVTQTFDANRQYVQSEFRKKEEELKKAGKAAEEAGDLEKANELYQEADSWQQKSVLFNMLAGGLSAPVDSATGILASTLAPAISYEIGQYFKDKDEEGSAQHILAHMILGGAIAAAGGNDALTGALAAGAAEVITPLLSNYLYGKDPGELTAEQKQTISAIAGLTGAAVGGIAGDSSQAALAGAEAAQNAVDNNYLKHPDALKLEELVQLSWRKGQCGETCQKELKRLEELDRKNNEDLAACEGSNSDECNKRRQEVRDAAAEYIRANLFFPDSGKGYSRERSETQFLAEDTMEGVGWAKAFGFGETTVEGFVSLAKITYTGLLALFQDEEAKTRVSIGLGETFDYFREPEHWLEFLGAMSPADREKLAQAYETGDSSAIGKLVGAQIANLPVGIGSVGKPGSVVRALEKAEVKAINATENAAGAADRVSTAMRVFVSPDPKVGETATKIEQALPGTVKDVNVPIGNPKSNIKGGSSDADIMMNNGDIIEVKTGSGTGATTQIANQQKLIGSTGEVIVYGPNLGLHVTRNIESNGTKVFTNIEDLVSYLKSKEGK